MLHKQNSYEQKNFKGPLSRILHAKARYRLLTPRTIGGFFSMLPFPLALGFYIQAQARTVWIGLPCPPCTSDSFSCCNTLHPILSAYLPHLVRCPALFAVLVRVYIETSA